MSEAAIAGWLLAGAWVSSVLGMGWLALSMQVHARQAWGHSSTSATSRLLRAIGGGALLVALVLCLIVDHATMAVLVWVMTLAGAALLTAFALAWKPQWLGLLAPWIRRVRHGPARTPHQS